VYSIKDVDDILEFITARIILALNIVAPEREIRVKKGPNLYLTQETLQAMKKRDAATGRRYRDLRNKVSRLVRRDKQDSNLLSLKKAGNNPKVLWHLVDQALGKDRPSLPASITGANGPTETPLEAAEVMNQFFLDKVDDLRKKALLPRLPEEAPDVTGEVLHVQQETCKVPQEATHGAQGVAHVAQEVGDVLQEADHNTTSPLLPLQVRELEEDVGGNKSPQQHRGLGDGRHTYFSAEERG
jgi:hypothetical protein